MKKFAKVMAFMLCAALLVCGGIFGTLAYLTAETGTITNTFTVGNVAITLDEAKTDMYGVVDASSPRVMANTLKLVPAKTYSKDPTVHVDEDSEACYLFVKVENGISAIEEAGEDVATQMTAKSWKQIGTSNIWYYNAEVEAGKDYVVFESVTISGTANVSAYADATIKITAYAVQKEGFATAQAAWDATFAANN